MSVYKDQLKKHLRDYELTEDLVLSIGNEHDDREYFKPRDHNRNLQIIQTMDNNAALRPTYIHDMNNPLYGDYDEAFENLRYGPFDAVLALELWEYIWDPAVAHTNIAYLLKPGGRYIGSYPFVYPIHNPIANDYLRYTPNGVLKLLTFAGLKAEVVAYRKADSPALLEFYSEDGLRASKDWPNHSVTGFIVHARKPKPI